ncbi:MAG: LemA family protein [Acidobacteria bacterium]|nr:LemA family protein [Acidobacteriota bacterium]
MNKILLIAVAVIVAIGGILALAGVSSYNSLYTKKEAIDAQWAEVEVQLQRRVDMVNQLVGAVQGALTQEQKVFGDIANARAGLTNALKGGSRDAVIDADNQLTSTLQRIQFLSIAEAYPELKSNANISRLQDEIAGTENRVSQARRDYNTTLQDYNTTRGRFPTVIFASMMGFEREDKYFAAAPGASEAPKVELNK